MNAINDLQKQIVDFLENQNTHRTLQDAAGDLPEELMNIQPEKIPYTFWQLLEHIRISQYDMIDFIRNPNYKEMEWPKEYWPDKNQKATKKLWDESIKQYEDDLEALKKIVKDNEPDILVAIPHGQGQTTLREIMQIIDHASYHIGEFILMRRICNAWKK
jgi:uncharacterized damage-inducible protein DinB